MIRLRSYSPFPPGGYSYKQTQGIVASFPDEGLDIHQLTKRVYEFRVANKLDRATLSEVMTDIDCYTCARLKGDSTFCYDTDQPAVYPAQPSGGCGSCGGPHVS